MQGNVEKNFTFSQFLKLPLEKKKKTPYKIKCAVLYKLKTSEYVEILKEIHRSFFQYRNLAVEINEYYLMTSHENILF